MVGNSIPRQPSTGARQGPPPTLLQEREGGRRQNDSCSKQSTEEGKGGRRGRLEKPDAALATARADRGEDTALRDGPPPGEGRPCRHAAGHRVRWEAALPAGGGDGGSEGECGEGEGVRLLVHARMVLDLLVLGGANYPEATSLQ